MSLIYEALKKAQVNLCKHQVPIRNKLNRNKGRLKIVFIMLLLVSFGVFVSKAIFFKSKGSKSKPATKKSPSTVELSFIKDLSGKPEKSDGLPNLILKGIVYDVKERLAIINDIVLKKGENIFGAVVDEIYPDRVELIYGKKKISLYLK